jgi:hypothetical protein
MATNSKVAFTDRLLTPAETAKRLRLTKMTLAIWRCRSGRKRKRANLIYTRIGRKIFYFESDVDAYARAGRSVVEAEPERKTA